MLLWKKEVLNTRPPLIYREIVNYSRNLVLVCEKATIQNDLTAALTLPHTISGADRGGGMSSVSLSSMFICGFAWPILLVLQYQGRTVNLCVQKT